MALKPFIFGLGLPSQWRLPQLNRQTALFFLYSAVFHIGLMGIGDVLLNFYFVSIGTDEPTIGLLQSLPRLGGFLTGIPVGLLANRIGSRRILIGSSLGVAIALATTILYPTLGALAVSRFMMGFFYGAGQIVTAPYMVTLIAKSQHTQQFAYHNLISMIATAFGSLFGGSLPLLAVWVFGLAPTTDHPAAQTPTAYGAALLVGALLIALSVLPLFWLPTTMPRINTGSRQNRLLTRAEWTRLLWLSLPLLLFGFSGGLTFPFYNLFFRERYGLTDGVVGMVMAFGWVAMAIAPMFNPYMERLHGRVRGLALLLVIAGLGFAGLAFSPLLWVALPFFALGIGVRNAMQPLYQPLLMEHVDERLHNLASSLGMVLWNVGWFGATVSFGLLQNLLGYGGIMGVVAVFVLLNALSVWGTFNTARLTSQNQ